MAARLASAGVGIPLLLTAIWYGSPWLLALLIVVAALATWEFCLLAAQTGARPFLLLAVAWAVAMVLSGHLQGDYLLAVLAAGLLTSLAWLLARGLREGSLAGWALTVGSALYVGLPLSFALLIRPLEQGREWLLLTLLVTFATDAAAYLVGRPLGRHPMAPTISPGKTWEGAAGGMVAGVGSSLGIVLFIDLLLDTQLMEMWQATLVGALIAGVAQVGDLAESLLKRAAGAKEAGWLIPGHGGLLDRLDSVVFPLVLMYYLARWLG